MRRPPHPDSETVSGSAGRWLVFMGGLVALAVLAVVGAALAVT